MLRKSGRCLRSGGVLCADEENPPKNNFLIKFPARRWPSDKVVVFERECLEMRFTHTDEQLPHVASLCWPRSPF